MNAKTKFDLLKKIVEESLIKEEAIIVKQRERLKQYETLRRLSEHEKISRTAALTSAAHQALFTDSIKKLKTAIDAINVEFKLDTDIPEMILEMDADFINALDDLIKNHPVAKTLVLEAAVKTISRSKKLDFAPNLEKVIEEFRIDVPELDDETPNLNNSTIILAKTLIAKDKNKNMSL